MDLEAIRSQHNASKAENENEIENEKEEEVFDDPLAFLMDEIEGGTLDIPVDVPVGHQSPRRPQHDQI